MKNFYIFSLLALILIFVSCQEKIKKAEFRKKEIHLIDNRIINDFLEYCFKNDSGIVKGCKVVLDHDLSQAPLSEEELLSVDGLDSIFTKEDIDYIHKQNNIKDDFRLQKQYFKNSIIVSADTISSMIKKSKDKDGRSTLFWEEFYKKYGDGFCTLSKPLFSKNHQIVIISSGYHCGGLCGGGGTYVLKKVNSDWKVIATIRDWVS